MTLNDFDGWVKGLLAIDDLARTDISLNGIQIGKEDQLLKRIAFAVDASLLSFEKARDWGAQLLFVHHGLFWGSPLAIRGSHLKRVELALQSNIALYAVHLPLDMHPQVGNNIVMAQRLGLKNIETFGDYRGIKIGFKGELAEPMSSQEIRDILFPGKEGINTLDFGSKKNRKIGIVSGGASREVLQAVDEGLDLYLTGEPSHQTYHFCKEQSINVIAAGHYNTEIFGVQAMAERVNKELGLVTTFLDIPTGL